MIRGLFNPDTLALTQHVVVCCYEHVLHVHNIHHLPPPCLSPQVAQGLFNPDTRTFVAGWEERAMESLQGHPSLQDKSDKQRKGLVMPFLKNKGKEAEVGGASVLR